MTNEMIAEFFITDEDLIQSPADMAEEICEIVAEVDNFIKG